MVVDVVKIEGAYHLIYRYTASWAFCFIEVVELEFAVADDLVFVLGRHHAFANSPEKGTTFFVELPIAKT